MTMVFGHSCRISEPTTRPLRSGSPMSIRTPSGRSRRTASSTSEPSVAMLTTSMPCTLQGWADRIREQLVIVDDQDADSCHPSAGISRMKLAPESDRPERDRAAVGLEHPPRDEQPEPRTGPRCAAGAASRERFEDPISLLDGHARPPIADRRPAPIRFSRATRTFTGDPVGEYASAFRTMLPIALLSCCGSARTTSRSGASMSTRFEAIPRLDDAHRLASDLHEIGVLDVSASRSPSTIAGAARSARRAVRALPSCGATAHDPHRRSGSPDASSSAARAPRRGPFSSWAVQAMPSSLERSRDRRMPPRPSRGNTAPTSEATPSEKSPCPSGTSPSRRTAGPARRASTPRHPVTCRNRARSEGRRRRRDPGPSDDVWSDARSLARRRVPIPSDAARNHPQPSRSGNTPDDGHVQVVVTRLRGEAEDLGRSRGPHQLGCQPEQGAHAGEGSFGFALNTSAVQHERRLPDQGAQHVRRDPRPWSWGRAPRRHPAHRHRT